MRALPPFRRLAARDQLQLSRDAGRLLPELLARGLCPGDALALAHNAALLGRAIEPPASPREVLGRLSLGEIADYCELYRQMEDGEIEYGEAKS